MGKVRFRWTQEQAWTWYQQQAVPYGFNFVPSSAVNTTEMWQAETFDPETIERELNWAANSGFNSCRVFLQYLVWQENPQSFKERIAHFLALAAKYGISIMPVLFDDCAFAGKEPYLGPQATAIPSVHNSGWTPSPGPTIGDTYARWPQLETYVKDIIGTFAADARVLMWDLYNEPGNNHRGSCSLPLLAQTFIWAREVNPSQPLTAGAWSGSPETDQLCLTLSDILTFHQYSNVDALGMYIDQLKQHGYPIICTEWMARTLDSKIATHLPNFIRERVGCYLWGLVQGKTQTHFPWGTPQGAAEPEIWFHDLFRKDGTPYDQEEIEILQNSGKAFRRS